jgi:hypothetical protein
VVFAITGAAVGDWLRAERCFAEARELTERADVRAFSARVLEAHADMLLRRDAAGDCERALTLYDQAGVEYGRYRLDPLRASAVGETDASVSGKPGLIQVPDVDLNRTTGRGGPSGRASHFAERSD